MPTPMPGDDLAVAVSALALWRMGGCSAGSSSCSRAILQGGMTGGPASRAPSCCRKWRGVGAGRRCRHCVTARGPLGVEARQCPGICASASNGTWNLDWKRAGRSAWGLGWVVQREACAARFSVAADGPVRCMFQRTARRIPTQRPFNGVVQGLKVLPIVLPAAHVKHPVSRGRCWICCRLRRSSLQGP